jgi:aspartyl-tRNA(Asn)/glutamyl-tRNA(Gln) amidotransferase subunit A
MTALHDMTAGELLAAYKTKKLSPVEAVDAVIAHIETWEPKLKALYAPDFEGARKAAKAAEKRWQAGNPQGALDGVPITIKENIATKGVPVPLGTAATDLVPAADDAPASARVREAGAVILAKTTMPDYGMLSSGRSSFHPLTRNPWNLAWNPGGSSAGAGAAAAAGYGPLHLGTDIGGSIRLPAGWCALFGLKPSQGRVPVDPFYLGRVAGPLTRTVTDAALMMATITRPDTRDGMSLPPEKLDWSSLSIDVKGLRIGLMLEPGCGLPVQDEVRDAVTAAAMAFERGGAKVVEVPPVMNRAMLDGVDDFFRARSWADFETYDPQTRTKILPYIITWAEKGATMSAANAIRGYNQTNEMRKAAARVFDTVDIVLSPTSPVTTFPAEWASPINDPLRPFEHIVFTVPWNMSENPAASINCGFNRKGDAIGLQIVGRRFADLTVLRVAKFYEDLRGAISWPQPSKLGAAAG